MKGQALFTHWRGTWKWVVAKDITCQWLNRHTTVEDCQLRKSSRREKNLQVGTLWKWNFVKKFHILMLGCYCWLLAFCKLDWLWYLCVCVWCVCVCVFLMCVRAVVKPQTSLLRWPRSDLNKTYFFCCCCSSSCLNLDVYQGEGFGQCVQVWEIQTCKTFKRMLFIRTKPNMCNK